MILEIRHLDTCLSDYFQGSSHIVLAVPVDGDMTLMDLRNAISDEFTNTDDISVPDETGFNEALQELIPLAVTFTDTPPLTDRIAFPTLDIPGEDDNHESVYAYFAIIQDPEPTW